MTNRTTAALLALCSLLRGPTALLGQSATGRFTITKTYATDPERNTLLIDVTFSGPAGDSLYVLYHPALKNSGYGNTGSTAADALVTQKADMASGLVTSDGFAETSSGFAGGNDGHSDLLLHHRITWRYAPAESGNVGPAARVAPAAPLPL